MALAPILQHSASPARLSIQQGPARMQMRQQPAAMDVQPGAGSIEIRHRDGRLSIDSTAARASMNYFSMLGLLDEISGISQRKGQQGVSQIVSEGLSYQAVEGGGGAIAAIARQRMFRQRQFTLGLMPGVPPAVSYTPGSVEINVSSSDARVQFQRRAPMIDIAPQPTQVSFSAPQLGFRVPGAPSLDLRG